MAWFCAQWLLFMVLADIARHKKHALQRVFGPDVRPQLLAQYALGAMHVWVAMSFSVAHTFRDWLGLDNVFVEGSLAHADLAIGCSFAYFVVDAVIILLVDLENQAMFLVHHALALLMGGCMSARIVGLTETSHYMFVIELSNVALSAWDFLRRHHRANPDLLRPWYDAVTPVFAATYVPCRTVLLTVVSWRLMRSIDSTTRTDLVAALWAATLLVLLMSWKFAIKVASIGRRVVLDKFPGLASFATLTYVLKAYVSLAWFMLVLPHSQHIPLGMTVIAVDAVHIVASLVGRSRLATLCVCTKIVVNGLFIYFTSRQEMGRNLLWLSAMSCNVGLLILRVIHLQGDRIVKCFEDRNLSPYATHYLLSAMVPLILMPYGTAPYTAIGLYFVGALIWAMFPDDKGISVGWMHLCVTAADVALLKWGA